MIPLRSYLGRAENILGVSHDSGGCDRLCRRGSCSLRFLSRHMIPLRVTALGSNLAFIAYGLALALRPV